MYNNIYNDIPLLTFERGIIAPALPLLIMILYNHASLAKHVTNESSLTKVYKDTVIKVRYTCIPAMILLCMSD